MLLALGRPAEVAHGSLRLSLSRDNTEQEAAYIVQAVAEVVAYLRKMSPLWQEKLNGQREFILSR